MYDPISRQAAIDALGEKPLAWTEGEYELGLQQQWESDVEALKNLPSAKPERLTDDDYEAIRIHLSAIKEGLCNQHRWKEAEEYERIIDRFVALVSDATERKKGKWIPVTKIYKVTEGQFPETHIEWADTTEPDEIDALRCSECGEVFDFQDARNWCTECGADMRGEQE